MTRAALMLGLLLMATAADAQSTARTVRIPGDGIGLRTFAVLLPADYDQTETRYPVLYLLHGGGQDHTAFMARRNFARRARVVDMIVVMPAADRGGSSPALAARYEDFLATHLVPYMDANYRTIAAPAARAIAGLSMGGMFAVGAGLRYPGVFGIVGAFSPAAPRIEPQPADGAGTHVYLACGTADSLLPVSRQLKARLEARGVAHEYHEVAGAGHTWDFWERQLDAFFRYLLAHRHWRAPGRDASAR